MQNCERLVQELIFENHRVNFDGKYKQLKTKFPKYTPEKVHKLLDWISQCQNQHFQTDYQPVPLSSVCEVQKSIVMLSLLTYILPTIDVNDDTLLTLTEQSSVEEKIVLTTLSKLIPNPCELDNVSLTNELINKISPTQYLKEISFELCANLELQSAKAELSSPLFLHVIYKLSKMCIPETHAATNPIIVSVCQTASALQRVFSEDSGGSLATLLIKCFYKCESPENLAQFTKCLNEFVNAIKGLQTTGNIWCAVEVETKRMWNLVNVSSCGSAHFLRVIYTQLAWRISTHKHFLALLHNSSIFNIEQAAILLHATFIAPNLAMGATLLTQLLAIDFENDQYNTQPIQKEYQQHNNNIDSFVIKFVELLQLLGDVLVVNTAFTPDSLFKFSPAFLEIRRILTTTTTPDQVTLEDIQEAVEVMGVTFEGMKNLANHLLM